MTFFVTWLLFSWVFALFLMHPSEDMTEAELRREILWPKILLSMVVGFSISVVAESPLVVVGLNAPSEQR